ncbi:hypothetical protein B0T10DRAFT_479317 [Thelonectria olida]|uniref:Uncharacterized protein n=1 Tax=Thelonectria olida TaxID=1576542 RepID=A0A9P9AUT2_9HYPO|nr:hypothetical protein B0T10DRAFT_479317 [Thelonectria olida]
MSGLEILGALASSIAVAQSLEATVKAINLLRNISEIQQQCDDLKKEIVMIDTFILEAKHNALPFSPEPSMNRPNEHPLIAQTAMRLSEIVIELNKILDRCTNGTRDLKLKLKKWKWVCERQAIEGLRDKARDTKSDLQTAIQFRLVSMVRNLHASQAASFEEVKLCVFAHQQATLTPEFSHKVLVQPPTEGSRVEEIEPNNEWGSIADDASQTTEILRSTLPIPDAHGRYNHSGTERSFMQVTPMQPLGARACDRNCQCRCHWNRQEYQNTRWGKPVMGSWLLQLRGINGRLNKACDEPSCKGGIDAAIKLEYQLPKWLWAGMVSFQAAYNGQPSLNLSLRPARTLDTYDSVFNLIASPWVLEKRLGDAFSYFPDDSRGGGDGLIEYALGFDRLDSVRLLLGFWKTILAKQGLPRRVGYMLKWYLENYRDLTDEQSHVLMTVRSYIDDNDGLEQGTTKIHSAVRQRNTAELQQALREQSWAIDEMDDTGNAPIHLAAQLNDSQGLELLMAANADVNCTSWQGCTPLMLTAIYNALECMQLLLADKRCRSCLEQKDSFGRTALYFAVQHEGSAVVGTLLAAGASAKTVDDMGRTLVHCLALNVRVAMCEAVDLVRLLRTYHIDLDAQDKEGLTSVHRAISENNLAALRALVEAGASIECIDNFGKNLLHFAAAYGDVEVIRYLIYLDLKGVDARLCVPNARSPWAAFVWQMEASDWQMVGGLRRPSPQVQDAFAELFFSALLQNLSHEVGLAEQLLQAAGQRDESTSCAHLDTLIKTNQKSYRDDIVKWYRGIRSYIQGGSWELAIEDLQGDIAEVRCQLDWTRRAMESASVSYWHVNEFLLEFPWPTAGVPDDEDGEEGSVTAEVEGTEESEEHGIDKAEDTEEKYEP